jgi:hypothetical protein
MTAPLHLVTDEREQLIRNIAAGRIAVREPEELDRTSIQLLCSILLDLTKDVARLKKKVADLEGRVP